MVLGNPETIKSCLCVFFNGTVVAEFKQDLEMSLVKNTKTKQQTIFTRIYINKLQNYNSHMVKSLILSLENHNLHPVKGKNLPWHTPTVVDTGVG